MPVEYSKLAFILLKGIWPYLNHSVFAIGALPKRPEQLIRIPLILDLFFISLKVSRNARLKLAFEFSTWNVKKSANNVALSEILFCSWKETLTCFFEYRVKVFPNGIKYYWF